MRLNVETVEVYKLLVADLSTTALPTTIMGLAILGVGFYVYHLTGLSSLLFITVVGGLASGVKLLLMRIHTRHNARGSLSYGETQRWEALHAITTTIVASSIGASVYIMFAQSDTHLQLLGTCLVFGYCSGIVGRVSVRPAIASAAISIAAFPSIVTLATNGGSSRQIVAAIFLVFLFGAYENIRFVHRKTAQHIALRLDMASLAQLDSLTALTNRLGLQKAYQELRRTDTAVAALALDLDGFKGVNDLYGHQVGDLVLVEVAQRLRHFAPKTATVARLGGDEFVVLYPASHEDAAALALSLTERLSDPFCVASYTIRIGASVGFAIGNAVLDPLSKLLELADKASYEIKRARAGAPIFAPRSAGGLTSVA